MIKILHIARPIAGVGTYISLLTRHIDNNKFTNVIICNKKDNNIELLDANKDKIKCYYTNLEREINLLKDLSCLIKIIKIIKKEKPNIIHCHSAKAGILGRISGFFLQISTFYTPHAYSYLSTTSKTKKITFKMIEYFFGFLPATTLACSLSEQQTAINDLKIKKTKVKVWTNSIEKNIQFKNSLELKKLPNKFLCSIGRLSYQKNPELLIHTVSEIKKQIQEIHLVILGVGFFSPLQKKIKKQIQEQSLEKNITLIPWIDRSKAMMILKKSQLYISTSRYEGLPYSIIEALNLSKPCVVTNISGNNDLISSNFNGYLVSNNAKEIAKKVVYLLENNELYKKLSFNARVEFLKKYDMKKNIKKLERIYLK
ncbi:glycosyltransferase [Tenacibaculum sp. UWU-22]|uniref:glycosyltransferase n=1 Tax=Tenacibaculum sp. UWU-22 TaxID=3234187 RepID=UPI0034DAE82E